MVLAGTVMLKDAPDTGCCFCAVMGAGPKLPLTPSVNPFLLVPIPITVLLLLIPPRAPGVMDLSDPAYGVMDLGPSGPLAVKVMGLCGPGPDMLPGGLVTTIGSKLLGLAEVGDTFGPVGAKVPGAGRYILSGALGTERSRGPARMDPGGCGTCAEPG